MHGCIDKGWWVKNGGFYSKNYSRKGTTAHSIGPRYGETTSNVVESFNSWILDIRELSITEMIDQLRINLMEWYGERRTKACEWETLFCKIYQDKWNKSVYNNRPWDIQRSKENKVEIFSQPTHCVDLRSHECTCFYWQKEGFPCIHGVACIIRLKLPVCDYVEEWFFTDTYLKSYETPINHVLPCMWRGTGGRDNQS